MLPKRIFSDLEEDIITIMVQMDGSHHTDLTIPNWVKFDEMEMVFSGKAPDLDVTTNFTFLITGYDPNDSFANTTFTMEVVPNGVCSPRDTYYMDCTAETYCSHTVLQDHFTEPDQDPLHSKSQGKHHQETVRRQQRGSCNLFSDQLLGRRAGHQFAVF